MSTKTNGRDGQHNVYNFYGDGSHDHTWYDSKTGQMGYHAEHCPADIKKAAGRAAAASTDGTRLKGVKGW